MTGFLVAARRLASLVSAADRPDRGAAMVEYALLLGLVAVTVIGALVSLGGDLTHVFQNTANCMANQSGPCPG